MTTELHAALAYLAPRLERVQPRTRAQPKLPPGLTLKLLDVTDFPLAELSFRAASAGGRHWVKVIRRDREDDSPVLSFYVDSCPQPIIVCDHFAIQAAAMYRFNRWGSQGLIERCLTELFTPVTLFVASTPTLEADNSLLAGWPSSDLKDEVDRMFREFGKW